MRNIMLIPFFVCFKFMFQSAKLWILWQLQHREIKHSKFTSKYSDLWTMTTRSNAMANFGTIGLQFQWCFSIDDWHACMIYHIQTHQTYLLGFCELLLLCTQKCHKYGWNVFFSFQYLEQIFDICLLFWWA